RNGAVERLNTDENAGWGVHAYAGGGWGFASISAADPESVKSTAARAVEIARASGTRHKTPTDLSIMPSEQGKYATQMGRDPVEGPWTHERPSRPGGWRTVGPAFRALRSHQLNTRLGFFRPTGRRIVRLPDRMGLSARV